MPTNLKIRLYRDEDASAVGALIRELQAHERRFEPRMSAPSWNQRSRCTEIMTD